MRRSCHTGWLWIWNLLYSVATSPRLEPVMTIQLYNCTVWRFAPWNCIICKGCSYWSLYTSQFVELNKLTRLTAANRSARLVSESLTVAGECDTTSWSGSGSTATRRAVSWRTTASTAASSDTSWSREPAAQCTGRLTRREHFTHAEHKRNNMSTSTSSVIRCCVIWQFRFTNVMQMQFVCYIPAIQCPIWSIL